MIRKHSISLLILFSLLFSLVPIGHFAPRTLAQTPVAGDLTVLDWAGYDAPEFWIDFKETYPDVDVSFEIGASDADIYAKMAAGDQADVFHPYTGWFQFYVDEGLVEEIDTTRLKNWDKVPDSFKALGQFDGKQYFIPWDWGYTSILYRTDKIPEGIDSWSALMDPKFSGHISMWDDGPGAVTVSCYIHGWDETKVTDEQLDQIKDEWSAQRDHNLFYWTGEPELVEAMAAGDARDSGRLRVEALRLRSHHGAVEAARAALVEHAVLVDQSVVADVVPAVLVAVVAADRQHDRRRLLRRVVVERDRVVHDHRLDRPVQRLLARRALAGAPAGAAHEGRLHSLCRTDPGVRVATHVHEVQAQARHAPAEPVLDAVGLSHPERVGGVSARVQLLPPAPAASRASHSNRDLGLRRAAPPHADQVEWLGRDPVRHASGRRELEVERLACVRGRRGRQGDQGAQERRCCDEQPH
jgi:hypothetical protein